MNRAETEDGSYASARNRKLLAEWAAKAGESEYAEPALNPCQTTEFAFFTDDQLPFDCCSRRYRRPVVITHPLTDTKISIKSAA